MEYRDYVTLVEPIRHRMVNSIWKIVRDPDDTDDVLQDVLLQIAKKDALIRKLPKPWIAARAPCGSSSLKPASV